MDPCSGANQVPLIVPSQRQSTSRPSNGLAGTCSRCGRTTEPGNVWNICRSCAAGGGLRPPPTVKPYGAPTATCAACRAAFRAPSHSQTAHVLCPPCQVRHPAPVVRPNPNPQDRTARRTNPYPVVPPIEKTPRALAMALAFRYPNLPVPPPPPPPMSAPLQSVDPIGGGGRVDASVNHGRDVLRVCMRFGCGTRLPAHVRGDACEACARAGFVRPPPGVVQKRVPRRATEHTCPRPRESLELVRASLLHEGAARGSEVTTEGRDVGSELEPELVYPDDTPDAIQYAPTTSDSKREELQFAEDEDVDLELELVYPEDAAEATWTSPPKPRTKTSPPATLCELFKDGLQTIPVLQNLATVADRRPPRRCRMLGCNAILPSQTCMQRCVKCSVGDWKRRTSAATDTPDPSRRPSTNSLATGASMEEKEVTNMLEEVSDVEDDHPQPTTSSPSKSSSSELTGDQAVSPVSSWDSDLTELSPSDSDTKDTSDSDSKPDLMPASPQGSITGLKIRIPLLVTRLPPDSPLRKCGNKRCNIALPKDHRWKTCDPCRAAQRVRFQNRRRSMMSIERLKSPDLSCQRWRSLSPDMPETDVTLATEASRPCSVRHCRSRIPLPEVYRWKTCTTCRARARREAFRKRDALLDVQHPSCQPEVVPRFPAYQNRVALLSSFEAQLRGFVEGQIMYFRAKLRDNGGWSQGQSEPWKPQHGPMVFLFVGEYSIVTGQRGDRERSNPNRDPYAKRPDKPAELEAMHREVSNIVLDMESLLLAKFRPGEAFAIDKGGIIMRFTCSLELIAQLRPLAATVDPGPGPGLSCASEPEASTSQGEDTSREDALLPVKPPPSPHTVPLYKTYSGELEAVVVPDESHRLLHGLRTVVRYRMVG